MIDNSIDMHSLRDRISRLPQAAQDFLNEEIRYEPTRPRPSQRKALTKEWIYRESELPWLKLPLDVPAAEILAESRSVWNRFVSHRSRDSRGWKSLCVRGLSPEQTLGPKPYGFANEREVPYRWTEIADLCPTTREFFQRSFPCRTFYRIRFMLLEPGGYIKPHRDRGEHFLTGLNIALNNPSGCVFKMRRAGLIPISDGDALLLDIANEHCVVNLSDEPRFHVIAHFGDPTDEWNRMVCDAYWQHSEQYPTRAPS